MTDEKKRSFLTKNRNHLAKLNRSQTTFEVPLPCVVSLPIWFESSQTKLYEFLDRWNPSFDFAKKKKKLARGHKNLMMMPFYSSRCSFVIWIFVDHFWWNASWQGSNDYLQTNGKKYFSCLKLKTVLSVILKIFSVLKSRTRIRTVTLNNKKSLPCPKQIRWT